MNNKMAVGNWFFLFSRKFIDVLCHNRLVIVITDAISNNVYSISGNINLLIDIFLNTCLAEPR